MSDATAQPVVSTARFHRFALAAVVLTLCFAGPLWRLFWFAIGDELYSYIPLMPVVCVYLAWTQKRPPNVSSPAVVPAALFFIAGLAGVAGYWFLAHSTAPMPEENVLAVSTLAWALCLTGAGCLFLGGSAMRALAFPFFMLIFMAPFPAPMRDGIESFLQHGSAVVADWMYFLAGTPASRDDTLFRLPGFSLEVAPECSGIHSTLVLFITSLVAGQVILRRPGRRAVLALAVIPLALLRNGFRVFVIGELCVHVGPQMIDSPIHRHGGPLFFVISLVPFFLLLYFLRKGERPNAPAQPSQPEKMT